MSYRGASWVPLYLIQRLRAALSKTTLTRNFIWEVIARHWPRNTHRAPRGSLRSLFQGVLKTLLLIKFNLIHPATNSMPFVVGVYREGIEGSAEQSLKLMSNTVSCCEYLANAEAQRQFKVEKTP